MGQLDLQLVFHMALPTPVGSLKPEVDNLASMQLRLVAVWALLQNINHWSRNNCENFRFTL